LELARREATVIEVGKIPYGKSWKQEDINALLVAHGQTGRVVRLKSGDPGIFGRLDEEMDALDRAGVPFDIVPGVTSATAAAASIKVSLTRRGRNSSFRLLTGHDVKGFAEQEWRDLAKPGAVAAIYMGVKASAFLRGRLMIHGCAEDTPVTAIENASRADQRVIATSLLDLPEALEEAAPNGPVMLFLGLSPRAAEAVAQEPEFQQELHAEAL
ncbi:MAG: SAM-dependent methyltransferase, partial [Pseudomonadota bacterium]